MRKLIFTVAVALSLSACGSSDPYQAALPNYKDQEAVQKAIETVKPEDKQMLFGYYFRKANEDHGLIPTKDTHPKMIADALAEQRKVIADMNAENAAREKADAAAMDKQMAEFNASMDALARQ